MSMWYTDIDSTVLAKEAGMLSSKKNLSVEEKKRLDAIFSTLYPNEFDDELMIKKH